VSDHMDDAELERIFEETLEREITRRRLLRAAGAGVVSLSAMNLLAACGGSSGTSKDEAKTIGPGEVESSLFFANWPYYIDVDEKTKKRPTIDAFERKYGVKVTYREEINDNNEFFGKVRQQYARGDSGGRDLHVVTDWLCARMKRLGYVQKFDKSQMPNAVKNIEPAVTGPDFDPERELSMPWQTGQVGVVYRSDKTGDLTSVNDLFDRSSRARSPCSRRCATAWAP
jgi:spermidine/putrescine transport system substrate-binding protein